MLAWSLAFDSSDLHGKGAGFVQALDAQSKLALNFVANQVLDELRRPSYWKPGPDNTTGKSFGITPTGRLSLSVGSVSPIARFLEDGTKAHKIYAVNARNLRFYWPKIGGIFIGKSVNHPGTKPLRFIEIEERRGAFTLPAALRLARDTALRQSGLG